MNDLASGTSSWSTKLVHGGLRYLEYYEFRLVREALIEREILWQIAPHIIRPLRFVRRTMTACVRPGCYGSACSCTTISAAGTCCRDPLGRPDQRRARQALVPNRFTRGFEYSDCFVDDARSWYSPRAMPPIAAPTSAPARARSISGRPTASGTLPSKTR